MGRSAIRWNRVPWFDLRVPLQIVPVCTDRFIREADVVMANQWPTAYSVAKLSARKGRKFHFIRDTEPWPVYGGYKGPSQQTSVAQSYRLPLTKIVVAPWLQDHLESKGIPVRGVLMNGTNVAQFKVGEKHYNDPPVIGMMFRANDPRKGMADGFRALAAVRNRYPGVKILLYGWTQPKTLPFDAEFHLRPVKERLRAIYAQCDIFLSPSLQEGFHNPPREAMAAQCAVVATNVGSIPYCAIPGETALVVEPGDVQGMTDALLHLVKNPDLVRTFGRKGFQHIQQFTWEKAASQLLEIFANP